MVLLNNTHVFDPSLFDPEYLNKRFIKGLVHLQGETSKASKQKTGNILYEQDWYVVLMPFSKMISRCFFSPIKLMRAR